jgi:hypothetical protein
MAAVATRKLHKAAVMGASRSARSCALIAPWIGRTAPASRPNAGQPSRPAIVRAPARPGACARTIVAAPATTVAVPSTAATPAGFAWTPSQPVVSSTSEASI